MGLWGLFNRVNTDECIAQAQERGARIVDVREPSEYAQGHVPCAVNVPLGSLDSAANMFPDKAEALYVYCLSGVRSSSACAKLKAMGYADVTDAGGIKSYHGPIER